MAEALRSAQADPAETPTASETVVEAEQARPVGGARTASRAERARKAGYRHRFVLLYFLLAVVAGGAIGAFVVVLGKPHAKAAARWSSFVPTGSGDARAKQIASFVARKYKLPSGRELAAALAGPPKVTGSGTTGDVPVRAIAIRPDTSTGKHEASDISIVDARQSVTYILCGLGNRCSITEGKPSAARHALLRREALELALYTFKYVNGINAVTVFLPPRPDAQAAATSVFLERRDVRDQLRVPLVRTLALKTPTIGAISKSDLAVVNRITQPRLYSYQYTQAQDGSAILVLDPIVLGT